MARPKNKPLLETQIRWAMKHTTSNPEAARFLHRTQYDYKKQAKQYIDSETGLTLWELHRTLGTHKVIQERNIPKTTKKIKQRRDAYDFLEYKKKHKPFGKEEYMLEDIYMNKYPNIRLDVVYDKLLKYGVKEEQCELCGFATKRKLDYRTPTKLIFKDDVGDFSLDNLMVICYNCNFIENFATPYRKNPSEFIYDEESGEVVPATTKIKKRIENRLLIMKKLDERNKKETATNDEPDAINYEHIEQYFSCLDTEEDVEST